MELPVELQSLLNLGIEIVVVFLLTQFAKYGFNFEGYKAQLIAALFSAVMVVINAALAKIPLEWQSVASVVLQLVVVLLGAFGLYKVYRQKFPKG